MNTFKRWTSSLIASFEGVVQQIENHEGMVSSAIREVEQNSARAKIQLQRVRRDGQSLRKKLIELQEQKEIWKERARKLSTDDEKKALECLKRFKRIEKQLSEVEVQEREHARLERDLARDLSLVEEKLIALRQQRNVMKTRQSRAEALRLIQQVDSSAVTEIDDIFSRWESQIATSEIGVSIPLGEDDELAADLTSKEEEDQLKELLLELRN